MITLQIPYTRRYFENEEIVISTCNSCRSVVGESGDEAELQTLEQQHSCTPTAKGASTEQ